MATIPPYLRKGDTIGLICPSGYMPPEKVQICIRVLQEWGYHVRLGHTIGSQFNYFSANDDQRLADLQLMLDDDSVKAILCARGGYGLSRIIDRINFTKFKRNPKWIIGYSDITLLHSHIFSNYKIATLHSPMAAAFNDGGHLNQYVQSLKDTLQGPIGSYSCAPHLLNRTGTATGKLVGGNLALLAHATGTSSQLKTRNKILFIEDVGEYIYNVDRMLHQLKRSGQLGYLSALMVGSFTDMKDTTIPFGKGAYEVIADVVSEYDYPVCFGFPTGHQTENYPLKIGVRYRVKITQEQVLLEELPFHTAYD